MTLLALLLTLAALGAPALAGPEAERLAPSGPRYEIARLQPGVRVELRSAPGGPRVARLGSRTEFGTARAFFVAERRRGWLGVPAPQLPNGQLGWIRDDPAALDTYPTSYSIRVELGARVVEVHWGEMTIERVPVTVGRTGSGTPPGTFSVTDALAGGELGPYYGCCVLALSGHQPDLPPDWIGGDRIAIHGTPGPVGGAASLGCLRASDADMVALFALVPIGAPVFIDA